MQQRAATEASPALAALVEAMRLVESDDASLTLGVEGAQLRLAEARRAQIEALVQETLGCRASLRFVDVERADSGAASESFKDVEEHPLVKAAIEIFDARIVRVEKAQASEDAVGG